MAMATVTCTCRACGAEFMASRRCANRAAANDYVEWATRNLDLCPACYRAEKRRETEERVAAQLKEWGVTLPPIEGVSDKQIAYAANLRAQYLASELGTRVSIWAKTVLFARTHPDEAAANCAAHGATVEQALERVLHEYPGVRVVDFVMTSTSARDLIDKLKGELCIP